MQCSLRFDLFSVTQSIKAVRCIPVCGICTGTAAVSRPRSEESHRHKYQEKLKCPRTPHRTSSTTSRGQADMQDLSQPNYHQIQIVIYRWGKSDLFIDSASNELQISIQSFNNFEKLVSNYIVKTEWYSQATIFTSTPQRTMLLCCSI